jgi:acyl-CoA dehydrogenase
MMDREQLASVATGIARKVAPIAAAGQEGRVNRRLIRALADEGLLPGLFPRRAGGTRDEGVSAVDLCVVRESLGRASTLAENAIAIQTLGAYPIVLAGSDEQAGRYAGPVARGESIAAFAITEPGAGTDAGALALRATAKATACPAPRSSSRTRRMRTSTPSLRGPKPRPEPRGSPPSS